MKSTIKFLAILSLFLISAWATSDTVLLISSHHHKLVSNIKDLNQHLSKLSDSEESLVETFEIAHSEDVNELFAKLKGVFQQNGVQPEQVSSFNTVNADKAKSTLRKFDQEMDTADFDTLESKIKSLVEDKESKHSLVFYFSSMRPRILHEVADTPAAVTGSQMFMHMTPLALSGLWVAGSLIIVLMIAIGCLSDIKTNDKFARNNLWVGKEA